LYAFSMELKKFGKSRQVVYQDGMYKFAIFIAKNKCLIYFY
jgi:hypothetical protein